MSKLENLLHNYNGLSGMKIDYAKMLYSSSSKVFLSKKGSQLLKDKTKLNRSSKSKLDATIQFQMLEMIQNERIRARQEKTSLEVFDIQNSIN